MRALTLAALLAALPALGRPALAAGAPSTQIWLGVSDVHLDIFDRSSRPSSYGFDTNLALFESAVAQMKRTVRDPAVVLISGDLLMHAFRKHVGGGPSDADDAGVESMRRIAAKLGRSFPKSQFAIALGNNDIPCGDYRSAAGSRYLARIARVWNPLVDRGGASPDFEASFLRGGYYSAGLPLPRLRLIVLNTVPFSSEYRGNCPAGGDPAPAELAWFTSILRDTPAGTRNIVLMHIPPGFDALATDYAYGFIAWPFLKAPYGVQLLDALESSPANVLYAIAGHTHRFDFRLAGGVPILGLGAVSPIFNNNPTYYALRLARDGSLRDIDLYAFDEARQTWLPPRSFDQAWGVRGVDRLQLARLHARIAASPAARALWNRQASGWSSSVDDSSEVWGDQWRLAWCAQEISTPDFALCAGIERRVRILPALVFLVLDAAISLVLVLALQRRLRT
ncbi:MAG: metallophosphoesterase [Candidatus Cybelea sp.]